MYSVCIEQNITDLFSKYMLYFKNEISKNLGIN